MIVNQSVIVNDWNPILNRATIEEAEGDVCELESKLDKVRRESQKRNGKM